MDTPQNRAEFEHRFHRVFELVQQKKYHQFPGTKESLLDVRLLPNGRLDFLSVDESARLIANTMLQFANFKMPAATDEHDQPSDRTDGD
ncbi:AVAST type 1 anti-phage system protein Avs1c [Pseudorhodoferax sp. Leaf265]|uniref:AVAST type 1 anti-phage system protein Avs1c n=1 Tax=Pseudorhodoferax sp. Leaf265 TaxID=1736315 RepID=UPI001910EBCB|nr:AVAST type 1 anti-phage system protein Avs1c [Pseudorhodoferax sp. Leaf265]